MTDDCPWETYLQVVELNSGIAFWYDQYFEVPNMKYDFQQCIDPSGCYEVTVYDYFGDGIEGEGLDLTYGNKKIASGGNFTRLAVYDVGNGCASRPPCKMLKLELTTDNFPGETYVSLFDYVTYVSLWEDVEFKEKEKTYVIEQCIDPLRCYELTIDDYAYDGFEGNGGYVITYDGDVLGTDVAENFTGWMTYPIGECDWLDDFYGETDDDYY